MNNLSEVPTVIVDSNRKTNCCPCDESKHICCLDDRIAFEDVYRNYSHNSPSQAVKQCFKNKAIDETKQFFQLNNGDFDNTKGDRILERHNSHKHEEKSQENIVDLDHIIIEEIHDDISYNFENWKFREAKTMLLDPKIEVGSSAIDTNVEICSDQSQTQNSAH